MYIVQGVPRNINLYCTGCPTKHDSDERRREDSLSSKFLKQKSQNTPMSWYSKMWPVLCLPDHRRYKEFNSGLGIFFI